MPLTPEQQGQQALDRTVRFALVLVVGVGAAALLGLGLAGYVAGRSIR